MAGLGPRINPSDVVGYPTTFKTIHPIDASSNERPFATPRSWTFVSETISDVEGFTEEEVTDMVVPVLVKDLHRNQSTIQRLVAHSNPK